MFNKLVLVEMISGESGKAVLQQSYEESRKLPKKIMEVKEFPGSSASSLSSPTWKLEISIYRYVEFLECFDHFHIIVI